MLEYDLLPGLAIFGVGMLAGFLLSLLINKVRTGSISAGKIRQDMDAYQVQVEAHFDETSEKFKKMAEHYQELYDHLSIGATTLCRPEHVATGLTDQSDKTKINDAGESVKANPTEAAESASSGKKQATKNSNEND